jgi:hypothetical protein
VAVVIVAIRRHGDDKEKSSPWRRYCSKCLIVVSKMKNPVATVAIYFSKVSKRPYKYFMM